MSLYESIAKRALFTLDPETAHHLAFKAIRSGFLHADKVSDPHTVAGIHLTNRIGLAAGFDKDALAVDRWHELGFGAMEVGTVTRHAQPGNDKPRLFRYPAQSAILNRMGFNNLGADAMAKRLESAKPKIPLGINLGKSKITELDQAAEDYAYSLKLLRSFGDYFVVNVSSPNTPGLRGLQDQSSLTKILWRLREIESAKPMFVKIAPDLDEQAMEDVVTVCRDMGITGIIATNTTISREGLPAGKYPEGGLSGAPLTQKADAALKFLSDLKSGLVLIGVGGVMTPADAVRKLQLGADFVQVYSGWIYGGPSWVPKLAQACKEFCAKKA